MSSNQKISRRKFAGLAATSALGALAFGARSAKASTRSASLRRPARRGVWKVIRNPRAVQAPLDVPNGQTWRYLLSYPFQVAPNLAGEYLNLKDCDFMGQDFESGTDIILYDRVGGLDPHRAIRVSRLEIAPNPNNGGQPAYMNKYPGMVGFVPLGAKGSDGQPHPHAGSGFALGAGAARPLDRSEGFADFPDRIGIGRYTGAKRYEYLELYQLKYDGTNLTVSPREVIASSALLPSSGHSFDNAGMGCALADGDDLLTGMMARKTAESPSACGLMRWRRSGGSWRPSDFGLVTPYDNSLEPTVVRDVDGSLLLHARGRRDAGPPLRIWRRANADSPWELRINVNHLIPSTPVTLNRAVDGTPFIACNLYQPEFHLPPGTHSDGGISRLEPKGWRGERSTLCLLPLNEARDGFDSQLIARDPRVEFGVPPHGTIWAADHPTASPVRLADGQWHCLMGFRLLEWIENAQFVPPSPQTGSYLDEVVSFGDPMPLWNF